MTFNVVHLEDVERLKVASVGGKGAQLGELSRIEGVRVPRGFCVTTDAFRRALSQLPGIDELWERLSCLRLEDREQIRELSADMRRTIEESAMPEGVAAEVGEALGRLGEDLAYAVRSSATAEDLPSASFAGQQDTYLN